ncbi:MAG: alpha-amylase family glycosyl hydrolase [Candidatus Hodarchaeota archaeon]
MKISEKARNQYRFDDSFFTSNGSVIFPTIYSVRLFTQKINSKKDLINFPELAVKSSEIYGIGLISEIFSHIIQIYKKQIDKELFQRLLNSLNKDLGAPKVNENLKEFIRKFPPLTRVHDEAEIEEYIQADTEGTQNKHIIINDILNLWLINNNPAFSNHLELFDDSEFEKKKQDYLALVDSIKLFFDQNPKFGPDNENLVNFLLYPSIKEPHSIKKQLEMINEKWGSIIEPSYYYKILSALDLFREEEKMRGLGPGEAQIYEYDYLEENYTEDRDWMPNVVMIAKNTYVWLDQLSTKYQRDIHTLDQIPDEELDQLARWGFNAIWLIGLWERSKASKIVKRWCGNPEAEASAYSLYDYIIANDLGGDKAFYNLKERTWKRRIRLASDMVPNHTGIDSKWIMERPDWFISLPYSPFPSYTYSGESLSKHNPRIGIYLEDHYFSRTDAAVTFKRVDHVTGDIHYIYHGNDGTSMPWNDTAQLNYLKPEVREAVIQSILDVARKFSIIRFDAAMTLTRRHYQRLWFPEPGTGGDIPSRAEYSMSKSEFHKAMPKEFWREVVERINQEMPDTLLLAEAFWLLEGFFVRTLGMHRVYNSAFMNMLRDEDNAKYRSVLKNTLEFDPLILKRFVNFMNNPDEDTAVNQFGKGDKYFGICILLVTLPGLPMFGHGQIEGFSEKYGMEYRRSYWNEDSDLDLIVHHKRVIFPLLKKRYLFSEVENFLLYDFFTPQGIVNEDVFAFSNRSGREKALIIYHNKYNETSGWINRSVAFIAKINDNERLIQRNLGEGLALERKDNYFCIFRNYFDGLEYIRRNQEIHERGLFFELRAYQCVAYIEFREIKDNEWNHYAHLHDFLGGNGVPSIEEALQTIIYQKLHKAFRELVLVTLKDDFIGFISEPKEEIITATCKELDSKLTSLLNEVNIFSGMDCIKDSVKKEIIHKYASFINLKSFNENLKTFNRKYINFFNDSLPIVPWNWGVILSWIFIHLLGKCDDEDMDYEFLTRSWIDEWALNRSIEWIIKEIRDQEHESTEAVLLVKIMTSHQNWVLPLLSENYTSEQTIKTVISDPEVQILIHVNRYKNILWFNKENFERLIRNLYIIGIINVISNKSDDIESIIKNVIHLTKISMKWLDKAKKANFQLDKFFEILNK